MYLQRLWSRPTSGGSRCGRRGRPLAGQAAAQAPGDGVVNGGGDRTVMLLAGMAMRVE